MGDRVHFKITFEVREQYRMTSELAERARTTFDYIEEVRGVPQQYRVAGSREIPGFANKDLYELASGLVVYVEALFPEIGLDVVEFWMRVEKDE